MLKSSRADFIQEQGGVSGENAVKGTPEGKGDSGWTSLATFLQKAGQGKKMAESAESGWRNLIQSSGGQIRSGGKDTLCTGCAGALPSTPAPSRTLQEPTGCPIIQSWHQLPRVRADPTGEPLSPTRLPPCHTPGESPMGSPVLGTKWLWIGGSHDSFLAFDDSPEWLAKLRKRLA